MSEGRILKPDKDFAKEVEKLIPEAQKLAKDNVNAAIEKLLVLEKQTRQASDLASTSQLLVAIVTICKDAQDWSLLNEQVLQLSRKHGQLKQAITKMVQEVMTFLDETPGLDKKLSVIETLRTVTDGKIYVEVERARVTRILSDIKKNQGDVKGAAEVLCELQVETFGSMDRREKTEFILDQVALCIENHDWPQAAILSRKISVRFFTQKAKKAEAKSDKEEEKQKKQKKEKDEEDEKPKKDEEAKQEVKKDDVTDLKLRYYEQQIMLAKHDDKYLDVCKHYRQVLDTEAIQNDPDMLRKALQHVIYFIILAPYDNEQSDLLHRIHRDGRNSLIPVEARLLKLFTVPELMPWHVVEEQYREHLCSTGVFSAQEPTSSSTSTSTSAADEEIQKRHRRWLDLRKRVIEHNVRVVAKYYTRIRLPRLTQLLGLDRVETEKYLSELVTAKTVYARIDRPAQLVSFAQPRQADDVLNDWSSNMKSLLGLLERIDHLITKEEMMGALQAKK